MFGKIKQAQRWWKALGQFEAIKKEIDMKNLKTLLVSKRFWVNLIGLAATLSGVLPQKLAVPLLAAANLGTKLIDMFLAE